MSKKSDPVASFSEDEGDYEDLEIEFQQLRLSHQRLHHVTQRAHRASSNIYGIAMFENLENEDENDQFYQVNEERDFSPTYDETVSASSISVASTVCSRNSAPAP